MHKIRESKRNNAPSVHVFVDTETSRVETGMPDWTHKECLRLWTASAVRMANGSVIRRKEASGTSADDFFRFLFDQTGNHHVTWLWAHNLTFDATVLGFLKRIEDGRLTWQGGSIGEAPVVFTVAIEGRSVKCVDTFNWFRCSLAQMGKDCGIDKLAMPKREESDSVWMEYCRRDTDILESTVCSLVSFIRECRLGKLCTTAPSQAWESWRYLHRGVWPLIHGIPELSDFERTGYFGGRCEVFYRGCVRQHDPSLREQRQFERKFGPTLWDESVYVLDAKQFYPFLMKGHKYPYKYVFMRDSMDTAKLANVLRNYAAMAEVRIKTDSDVYPVKDDGITKYAIGVYWTVLAGPELKYALERGHITQVGRVAVYEQAALFDDWVDHVIGLEERFKAVDNTSWAAMCKVLRNSLHGKFGQRLSSWVDDPAAECKEKWGRWIKTDWEVTETASYRGIGGNPQRRQKHGEWDQAFVPIAAYVASYGRVHMRELMAECPKHTLLYHDTDSLHVLRNGYLTLKEKGYVQAEQAGSLQVSGPYREAEYRNVKAYRIDGQVKVSGVPKRAEEKGFWSFEYDEFEHFLHMTLRGPDESVLVRAKKEFRTNHLTKGRVGADGWVLPCVVDKDQRTGQTPATDRPAVELPAGSRQTLLPPLLDD